MGALPKSRMTVDEFLDWSQLQEGKRYELVNGEIVMMSPETVRHVEVKTEAWLALRNAIGKAGLPCRAFGDGVSVRIGQHILREPDISVQCKRIDRDSLELDEPIVVVEVVSPTSARSDTGTKIAEYFQVESVRHYLIIDPYSDLIIQHSRAEMGIQTSVHRSGSLQLDPPGLSVAIDDLLARHLNEEQ
jgi:Uma2 family endonuclease